jgi:alpha-N-acetylglucosaminidase
MTAIRHLAENDAFDGKRWVYGYVHNYGGSNPAYGDLEFYRRI